jgi:hypothetical protein
MMKRLGTTQKEIFNKREGIFTCTILGKVRKVVGTCSKKP